MLVKQAANVLALLETFANAGRPLSLSDIAHQLGWPKSSTFKLLGTLVELGFLYEPRARGGYYPTTRWLELASRIARAQPIPPPLERLVADLAAQTSETAVLAAPAGHNAVFLHVAESPRPVRYAASVGQLVPIHATAVGRALLALYLPAERAALLERVQYERHTPFTLMDARSVEASISASLALGWFKGGGGLTQDFGGVALPLQVEGRRFSVLVGGPTTRVDGTYESLANLMRATVERHLGGRTE